MTNPSQTLIHNATVYTHSGIHRGGWVFVRGTRIASVGWDSESPAGGAERIDARGRALAPGLIDIHVHGALGSEALDANPEALERMARFFARHGVTAFLATTMTAPTEAILSALYNISGVMRSGTGGATLMGAHVEGPYVDVTRSGAQDPSLVHRACLAEYQRFLDTKVVKLITVAPELAGVPGLVRYALNHGAAVAIGHTRADYDEVCRAVALGVTQVTHLFNGMEPLHHRQPGAVGAALVLDALYCQLIADNIHVHPAVLKLVIMAKGVERVILVTDARGVTGMPDGEYAFGGTTITLNDGEARIPGGALAGSTLTLERAVRNIMVSADLTLHQALKMATAVPARALGIGNRKGTIAEGMDADLIILDDQVGVWLTMVEGKVVYRR